MVQDNEARRDAVPQHVVDSVVIPEAADEARDSEFRISPRIEDWIGVIVMVLLVAITFATWWSATSPTNRSPGPRSSRSS